MPMKRSLSLFFALLVFLFSILGCNFQVGVQDNPGNVPEAEGSPNSESVATETSTPQEAPSEGPTPAEPESGSPTEQALPESEEGLRVAYIKDGNVWLWEEDGSSRALTSSGGAQEVNLSDDGLIVAFKRAVDDIQSELWAVNTDGSGERLLVAAADFEAMDADQRDPNSIALSPYRFEWLPGSHLLVFNTEQRYQGPGLGNFDDLRQVDAESGALTTLLPAGQGGDFYFSPDGTQAAVVTPEQISLMNADGSNLRSAILPYDPVSTYSEYMYYARPVWSPDSTYLMAAIPPAEPLAEPLEPTRLYRIPIDGSPAEELGSVIAYSLAGFGVSYSPDLSRIAYTKPVGQPPDNTSELHVADSNGANDSIFLTEENLLLFGWSPDSLRFTFSMGNNMEMQLGTDGGGFQPLNSSYQGIFNLRWVDPERYLLLRENNGAIELWLETLNGAQTQIDTLTSGFAGGPAVFDYSD